MTLSCRRGNKTTVLTSGNESGFLEMWTLSTDSVGLLGWWQNEPIFCRVSSNVLSKIERGGYFENKRKHEVYLSSHPFVKEVT